MQNSVPTSTPQCDVDPAGDLILLVGQGANQRPIRVSSKVLSLASPVFTTMFGPRCLEGHVLSKQAKLSIPSFPLPEEDPEAMTWFCRAVHLQLDADIQKMELGLILEIAALCDKYDASTALSGWSRLLMESNSQSLLGIYTYPYTHPNLVDHTSFALYTSYAFKNHRTFWLATRTVIHHSSPKDIFAHKKKFKGSDLPDQLFDSIGTQYRTTILTFQRAIEGVISPYTNHKCPPAHRDHREMCGVLTVIGHYFQELSLLDLWPMSKLDVPEAGSFSQIKAKISQFESRDMSTLAISKNACVFNPIIDIKEALHMAAEEIFRNQKGLCLRCVNEGRVMVSSGNCRAEFHDSCTGKD